MSTIATDILDPARLAARAGTTIGQRAVPQTDRLEAEDDDEPTPVKVDRLVAENRARTPRAAAEMRRTPRLSLAELNELDQEEIARRLSKIRRDDRTPIEQALDLIDLPRNVVMQAVAPGLARQARQRGETGTFGLGKVYASDVLNEMGVENRIVRSLVGFAGDVALDPLTYVGPAGWGAMLAGKGGSAAVRAAGKKAIKSAIADAAAGRAVRDPSLAKYFAAKGLSKAAEESYAQAYTRIERAVRGAVDEGYIHKGFIPFGADRQYAGGTLVDDLFSPIKSDASVAAGEFFERYGRGTRGFGPVGGSEVAHIPFTDISLRVRPFSQEARRATETHRMARLRESDLPEAFMDDVRGGPIVAARLAIGTRADDALEAQRAMHEESMRYEAMKKSATRPPDPEPPAGASSPAPDPSTPPGTPGAVESVMGSPATKIRDEVGNELRAEMWKADDGWIVRVSDPEGRDAAAASIPGVDHVVSLVKFANEADAMKQFDNAMGRRAAPQVAQATPQTAAQGSTPEVTVSGGDVVVGAPPATERERFMRETHEAFAEVPEDDRAAALAVTDAFVNAEARRQGIEPEQVWKGLRAQRGTEGMGGSLEQAARGAFAQVMTPQGSRRIIAALESPDLSTLVHETGHMIRSFLPPEELDTVSRVYGIDPAAWGRPLDAGAAGTQRRAAEERFAQDFERYLATGELPAAIDEATRSTLAAAFDRIKEFLLDLYKSIIGTPLEDRLHPEIKGVFDRALGGAGVKAGDTPRVKAGSFNRADLTNNVMVGTDDLRYAKRGVRSYDPDDPEYAAMAELGETASVPTAFAGEVPSEIRDLLLPHERMWLRPNSKAGAGAGAEDVMGTIGPDEYVRRLRLMHTSEEAMAVEMARKAKVGEGIAPIARLSAKILEDMPARGRRKSLTGADRFRVDIERPGRRSSATLRFAKLANPHTLAPGTELSIAGRAYTVQDDADGVRLLVSDDGEAFELGRAGEGAWIESLPFDPGSLRGPGFDSPIGSYSPGAPLDDIPFSPLYQRVSKARVADTAGQEGMFGQGTYGSSGQQGSLFGGQSAPPPAAATPPATDPQDPFRGGVPTPERMVGETDDAYRKRLAEHAKWRAAAKNTGLLFQSSDPGSPAALIDMEHSAFQQQSAERLQGIVDAARAAYQQAKAAMESGRALDAVPTPANVRQELALQEALIDAKTELDRAESVLQQAKLARTLSKSLADMDDLIDQVALIGERDVAEDLLYLFREDPDFADQYVEMLQNGVHTAGMQVDVLRGAISTTLTRPETVLMERAKQLIGTGDAWIAASLFAPVARMIGKDGTEDSQLVQTLWGIDRAFRTLGIRGGTMNRQLARIKALYRHAAMEGARVEDAINRDLAGVLKSAGKSDQLAAAGQLVYARMHTMRGQGENYNLWRFDPAGPVYDEATGQIVNRSGLADLLHQAQEGSGLLTDQAVREAVDRIAGEQLAYLRTLGDAEVEDLILGARLEGYVPVTTARDFGDAVRLQKEGYGPTGNLRPRDRGKEPFQKGPRLTMQTRFVDPELLGKDGKPQWRRFFEGDRYLTEMSPEQIAQTMARRYQGNETIIAKRTAEKLEAREAVLRYDELKQDAAFAEKYPMRPTDGIELNELFADGRFDYLTGSNPAPENFIETNAAMVMANRTMQHQRARAARLFKDLYRESFIVDPVLLHNVAGSGVEGAGETKKLANGKPFRVLAPQQTRVGGHAPTVLIDGERYRLLDSSVRADAADHPVLRGLFGGEQLDGRLFQHQFADAIEDLALALRPERAEQIIRVYDTFQSAWKMLTLTSPSWPIFNLVGNITLAIMGGANPLTMARHALDAGRVITRQANRDALADLRLSIRGQEITGDILLALARDRGVVNNTLSLEFAGAAARADKSVLQVPDRLMRRYLSPWFRANQMADDTVRLAAFISHLEDGADATTAANKVLRSMFDYADFTVIEERLFRRLFPFYSWMRSNLGYQMAMMLERPGYANLAPKLKRAIEEAAAGDDRVPENLRPSWMRESLAAQIGSDPQSRFALMLGGNILPQSDMMRVLTPIFGVDGAMRFFHFVGSSISPIIVKPAELAFGRELFSGREIGGDLGIGQFTSSIFRPFSEYGPVGLAAAAGGAVAGGVLGGTPGAVAGGVIGAQSAVVAGEMGGRVGRSADRSIPLAVARSLVGGRVQAFDADRLDTTVAREIRDIEGRIRGRIRAAEREGDEDESLQARAELLALYRDLVQRGQEDAVPKWARQFLGRAAAQPVAIAD